MTRSPGGSSSTLFETVHDRFRSVVLDHDFSCVGAKSAVRRGTYRMALYEDLGSPRSTRGLLHDLQAFAIEYRRDRPVFSSFVACFTGPEFRDEEQFETVLWRQLQELHELDTQEFAWDPSVAADPNNKDFSFSIGGQAFFVVGMHPASSRLARRFDWPVLAFNPHDQFEQLRHDGRFASIRGAIRSRETALQGSINPSLRDYGSGSEARQYSGRLVEADWRCPFHPHRPEFAKPSEEIRA